jgi:hypothetical protein
MALSNYEKERLLTLLNEEEANEGLVSFVFEEVIKEIIAEIARSLFENLLDWFFNS